MTSKKLRHIDVKTYGVLADIVPEISLPTSSPYNLLKRLNKLFPAFAYYARGCEITINGVEVDYLHTNFNDYTGIVLVEIFPKIHGNILDAIGDFFGFIGDAISAVGEAVVGFVSGVVGAIFGIFEGEETPTPSNTPSFSIFSKVDNVEKQGNIIPVVYGTEVRSGSVVVRSKLSPEGIAVGNSNYGSFGTEWLATSSADVIDILGHDVIINRLDVSTTDDAQRIREGILFGGTPLSVFEIDLVTGDQGTSNQFYCFERGSTTPTETYYNYETRGTDEFSARWDNSYRFVASNSGIFSFPTDATGATIVSGLNEWTLPADSDIQPVIGTVTSPNVGSVEMLFRSGGTYVVDPDDPTNNFSLTLLANMKRKLTTETSWFVVSDALAPWLGTEFKRNAANALFLDDPATNVDGGIWDFEFQPTLFRTSRIIRDSKNVTQINSDLSFLGWNEVLPTDLPTLITNNGIDTQDNSVSFINFIMSSQYFGNSIPKREYILAGQPTIDLSDNSSSRSDNVSQQLYDVLTNNIYGLGLQTTDIDETSFLSVAQYCDGFLSGGVRRWTSNFNITGPREAVKTFKQLTEIIGASIYKNKDDKIALTIDRPHTVDRIIGTADIVGSDGIIINSLSEKDKLDQVRVEFKNRESLYNTEFVTVQTSENTSTNTVSSISSFNTVTAEEATRVGAMSLYKSRYLSDSYEVSVGPAYHNIEIGDVVLLADNDNARRQFSGKLGLVGTVDFREGVTIPSDTATGWSNSDGMSVTVDTTGTKIPGITDTLRLSSPSGNLTTSPQFTIPSNPDNEDRLVRISFEIAQENWTAASQVVVQIMAGGGLYMIDNIFLGETSVTISALVPTNESCQLFFVGVSFFQQNIYYIGPISIEVSDELINTVETVEAGFFLLDRPYTPQGDTELDTNLRFFTVDDAGNAVSALISNVSKDGYIIHAPSITVPIGDFNDNGTENRASNAYLLGVDAVYTPHTGKSWIITHDPARLIEPTTSVIPRMGKVTQKVIRKNETIQLVLRQYDPFIFRHIDLNTDFSTLANSRVHSKRWFEEIVGGSAVSGSFHTIDGGDASTTDTNLMPVDGGNAERKAFVE